MLSDIDRFWLNRLLRALRGGTEQMSEWKNERGEESLQIVAETNAATG